MLHDDISVPDIVDRECAHEFLKEATKLASSSDLTDTGLKLEEKSRLFQELLHPEVISDLDEARLKELLRRIFFLRRKTSLLLKSNGFGKIKREIRRLLNEEASVGERFQRFTEEIEGLKPLMTISLASELLHYSSPERYWLWTYWIWDPNTTGGALPLVLQQNETDLSGEDHGETYEKVGRAIASVDAMGHVEGFTNLGRGLFGTNVYLASVYAVYMYTVFRMRLSEEFNRILPELPEFTRRILGVYHLNGEKAHV